METIYLAGGCLWGVQAFLKTLKGVQLTEAGRANGSTHSIDGDYDGYAECVKTVFDPEVVSLFQLMDYFFEIIDPYSLNQQGIDIGTKYRTGVYSESHQHIVDCLSYLANRDDCESIVVEVLPLTNFVRSAEEHQDHLERYPNDYCHIPFRLLHKYQQ